ncbi:PepSY domain-containing protein [Pseudonocardia sp. KRD291]|uniref:PepSY-associated TM helix domain-containing protein n=1 Tax=Pseudonocardia sp. KRD291 TaxID=2792007 RepID=UPI001C49FB25|nr:PepSY-associated TM helix domain-containing protein [Pseudonocardia sp. KRD291]MBW0101352.1 PepSY domain-containing protein [Pseudonocardia sp. KRD291]
MSETTRTRPPVEPDPPSDPGPGPRPPRSGVETWWAGLRPLLMRLHFYAGLFVGPFLLVAAVTGLLYTLTPQIDRALYADVLTAPVTGPAVPVRDQVAAAMAAQPGLPVTAVRPAPEPGATTRVSFDAGLEPSYARTVFVDPSTGGARATVDTYTEWMPFRATIDNLHRSLLLGDPGRIYSELAASWLWVLTLSGLVIWVVRRRRAHRVRRTLLPRDTGPGRARLRSWHGSVGLWAAVGMLFLSATGLTWSQFAGANVDTMRSAFDWTTPSVSDTLPAAADPGAGPVATGPVAPSPADSVAVQSDRVLAAARGTGMAGPVEIVPADPGGAWTVTQTTRSWPTQQDSVAVDPSSGAVVDQLRFADWPVAAKLARWGIDAHMGLLFGVANQILLAVLALGIICLVVWGYRMWWLRRPTRGGFAGPPGARSRPTFSAVLTVGAVAVVVGLALPVLGASLIVFLLVDAVVQSLRSEDPVAAG